MGIATSDATRLRHVTRPMRPTAPRAGGRGEPYPAVMDPADELVECRMLVPDAGVDSLTENLLALCGPGADLVGEALDLAARAHEQHRRDEGKPYIVHPLRVAGSLANVGVSAEVCAAALLHDVIEDAPRHAAEVHALGPRVAALVDALTEDWGEWPEEYYGRIVAAGEDAARIKLADRVDNLRFVHLTGPAKQVRYLRETNRHFGGIVATARLPELGDALVALLQWNHDRLSENSGDGYT